MDISNNLPTKIPIFPLSNFIVFPDTTVPLNIFEPRYLQMINDSMASGVLQELQEILNSEVDAESITRRAFEVQEKVLNGLTTGKSEDEVFRLLEGRLGSGQARTLARKQMSSR